MDAAEQNQAFWQRVKQAFGDAFERDPTERADWLQHLGREDPAVRDEVVSLLAALAGADDERDLSASVPVRGHSAGSFASTQLGRYRLLSRLGAGGMGEVYLAHDPILDREVALKILAGDVSRAGHRRAWFLREARAAAGLNHPHITTIHEVGEVDGRHFLALEYVRGRSLREHLRDGAPGRRELLELAIPLAEALAFAHARGIVHRDVKASNVMVTEHGAPKLLDFGLAQVAPDHARAASDEPLDALTGRAIGTPAAMSPEQARGEPTDGRSDVFSFGSLLYEMAAGRPAFTGASVHETLAAVLDGEPQDLRTLRRDLPESFFAIVERCHAKQPAARPEMHEVAAALSELRRAHDAAPAPRVEHVRRRALLLGVSIVALALMLLVWSSNSTTPTDSAMPLPTWAAVVAFEDVDDPSDSDQLGGMFQRLLVAHLAASGGISLVPADRLAQAVASLGLPPGRVPLSHAAEVGRAAGVGAMIVGRVAHVDGGLQASVEVSDPRDGRLLGTAEARGSSASDLFAMAGSLGRQVRVLTSAPVLLPAERDALERQYTSSVDAYRAFVRGLDALDRNHAADAVAGFREAVTFDPSFALAHYRLATSLVWTGDFLDVNQALERALAFREYLPDDLRLVLEALPASYFFDDDTRPALPMLEAALAIAPDNRDALSMLGEIRTHSATRNDARQAARLFGHLVDLDPDHSLVYDHLLIANLALRRADEARALLTRWTRSGADVRQLSATLALWEGRLSEAAAALDDALPALVLAGDEAMLADLAARPFDELVEGADRTGVDRVLSLGLRADVLLQRGRLDDAGRLYAAAYDVAGTRSRDGFHTSLRSGEALRRAELLVLLGDLEGARAQVDEVLSVQPDAPRFLSQAGRLALRCGDRDTARAHLDTLRALPTSEWTPTTALHRDALEAALALADGRTADATRTLEALVSSGRALEDWGAFRSSAGPEWRELLARARLASGDPTGAAAALDALFAAGLERARHPTLELRTHLLRAQLARDAGDLSLAAEHLAPVLRALGAAQGVALADEARALADILRDG